MKKKNIKNQPNTFIVNNRKFSKISQDGMCLLFLMKNENKKMQTSEIIDVVSQKYKRVTGKKFRETTGRPLRKLLGLGIIHRASKGSFYFNGKFRENRTDNFTENQKKEILERDNHTCCYCGITQNEGGLLTVDHIDPQEKGGKAEIGNGMALCTACENKKSNYDVRSFGKKMFSKFNKLAIRKKDKDLENFTNEILDIFEKYKQS